MALKIFVFISLVLAIIFYFLPIDKIKKELTFHSQKSVDKINEMAEKISRNNENL